jgi:hypothetical protein
MGNGMSNHLCFRKFSRPRQVCVDLWKVYDAAMTRMKDWERRHGKKNKWMIAECDRSFNAFEDAVTRELLDLNS